MDLHYILETCVLFHGNFFDRRLNIVSSVMLQSEIIRQSTYFSPVYIFVKNFHKTDFEPYLNPEEANRADVNAQVQEHNMLCVERPEWKGEGACSPLGSKNPAARRRRQSVLLWHMTRIYVSEMCPL